MSPAPSGRAAAPSVVIRDDGALVIGRAVIAADDLHVRTTTSSGPGGQHANRARTRVVITLDVASAVLSETDRARLLEALGPVVRTSAGRFRSQAMNRTAALEQLGARLAEALAPVTPRRHTAPTRASRERRLEEKKARARLKSSRRAADD